MKILKKIGGLLVIVFGIFLFGFYVNSVEAASAVEFEQNPTKRYFKNYGITNSWSTNAYTRVKYIDGGLAYCIQTKRKVANDYIKDPTPLTDERAKVAGQIISLVNEDLFNSDIEKYMYVDAVLNTYFSSEGYKTSVKYTDSDGYIEQTIKQAKIDVSSRQTNLKNPKLTTSIGYSKLSSGGVISSRITLSDLVKDFNGTIPTYTISASATNGGTAQICTGSNGSGCQTAINVKNDNDNVYNFYVKVTGYDTSKSTRVNINVSTGLVSYQYPIAVRYVAKEDANANGSRQTLVVLNTASGSDSASRTTSFNISATPNITLFKMNEDGQKLSGAKFTLSGNNFGSNVSGNETSDGIFEWSIESIAAENFFGNEFTLDEISAPDGYVKSQPYKFVTESSGSACYDIDGNQVDSAYCDVSKYVNSCPEGYTYIEADKRCEKPSVEYVEKQDENTSEFNLADLSSTGFYDVEYSFNKENGKYSLVNPVSIGSLDEEGIKSLGGKYICKTIDTTQNNVCDQLYGVTNVAYSEENATYLVSGISYSAELPDPDIEASICKFNGEEINSHCDELISKYTYVSASGSDISINMYNARNTIKISKQAILGEEAVEVSGAKLKICTDENYEADGKKCEAATTIDDLVMEWTSSSHSIEWRGLKAGEYYIIETTPPAGYILVDAVTKFSIDEDGVVKSGGTEVEGNHIIVNNQLNTLTISKTDIATGKELPGAELSICIAYKDENGEYYMPEAIDGNCLVTNLYDGNNASWISTDQPKVINGLASGTYYLVERIAPEGYVTAESILFTVKDDGTITDKDGKDIKDKKIVMEDMLIEDVKTGQLPMVIVTVILMISIGGIVYYGINNNNDDDSNNNNRLRGRKIHNV